MADARRRCPACGADAFVPSPADAAGGGCERCGYVAGEALRCPHCRAVARIEGEGQRAVCAACGGPRIPSGLGGKASTDALREQKRALDSARLASMAVVVQATLAVLATLLALAIHPVTVIGQLVAFALAAGPLVLAVVSRARAAGARHRAGAAGERAWQHAAEDAARQAQANGQSGVRVADLATMLGVDESRADELLTSLAVQDRTRIDVGDDAEIRYSVTPETAATPVEGPDEPPGKRATVR